MKTKCPYADCDFFIEFPTDEDYCPNAPWEDTCPCPKTRGIICTPSILMDVQPTEPDKDPTHAFVDQIIPTGDLPDIDETIVPEYGLFDYVPDGSEEEGQDDD